MNPKCPECGSDYVEASSRGVRFEDDGNQFSWFRCVNCGYNWEAHLGIDPDRQKAHKYEQLKVAIQDLLAELRIDEDCLRVMADGYSPDYPGGPYFKILEERTKNSGVQIVGVPSWPSPCCKVQLSKVVAQKLLKAGVVEKT